MVSQITDHSSVCSTAWSSCQQRKHQSSILLVLCVRKSYRWQMHSPDKGPLMRKAFICHDVTMKRIFYSCMGLYLSKYHKHEIMNLTYIAFKWMWHCGELCSHDVYSNIINYLSHWKMLQFAVCLEISKIYISFALCKRDSSSVFYFAFI